MRGNTFHNTVEYAQPEGCVRCPIRSRALFGKIIEDDLLNLVYSLKVTKSNIAPKFTIFREGDKTDKCYTLNSGWMILYKTLKTGKRQIINFVLPGDFLGLDLNEDGRQLYSLETLTESSLCVFPSSKLKNVMKKNISLLQGYNKKLIQNNTLHVQHLVNVGRMDSKQRLAAIIMELFSRAGYSRDNKGRKFMHFPPTQEDLADLLGLTQVHVNRVMRSIIEDKIISCNRKIITILQEDKLKNIAEA